jgi:hypothetical protein
MLGYLPRRETDAHGQYAGDLDGWLTAGHDSHSGDTGMSAHHSERQPLRRLTAFAPTGFVPLPLAPAGP